MSETFTTYHEGKPIEWLPVSQLPKSLGVDPMKPQVYIIERGDLSVLDLNRLAEQWRKLVEDERMSRESVVIVTDVLLNPVSEFSYDVAHRILMLQGKRVTRKAWLRVNAPYLPCIYFENGVIWHDPGDGRSRLPWLTMQSDLTATDWMMANISNNWKVMLGAELLWESDLPHVVGAIIQERTTKNTRDMRVVSCDKETRVCKVVCVLEGCESDAAKRS